MNNENGKSVLVFLLALVWFILVLWLYIHESKTPRPDPVVIDYHTDSYVDEELLALTEKTNISSSVIDQEDIFTYFEEDNSTQPVSTRIVEFNPCAPFECFTSDEFVDLYNIFEQNQNLIFANKYIYNVEEVDSYIKQKAEARGYKPRGFVNETQLIAFENVLTRPEVKESYVRLRNAMLEEGMRLHFVSGYRSSISQRYIFTNKMDIANPLEITTGIHDTKINEILITSSIPGYSKHHSGYAVDFGCGNDYLVYSFAETECYEWLAENNFHQAKTYGFIPSYPNDVENQGPNPEPWEFVWVGKESLIKT